MLQRAKGRPLADHAEAGFEQWLIIGAAIVGDQHLELFQVLVKSAELAGLFAKFTHEKLADAKSLRREAAHSDQKRVRSGASRQTSCLGVEEAPLRGRNAADQAIGDGV